ncbi:methyl-accepting chemotaxis protein [Anoxybacillus sp. TBDG-1]
MTVRKKLFAGFSAVLLVLCIVVAVGYFQIKTVDSKYSQLLDENVKQLLLVKQLEIAIKKEQGSMRGYLIVGDETSLTNFEKAHEEYIHLSDELSNTLVEPEVKEKLEQLNKLEIEFYKFGKKVFQLKRASDVEHYTKLVATEGRELMKQFDDAADDLADFKQRMLEKASDVNSAQVASVQRWMIIWGIIALIIGIGVALYISFLISRPVRALSKMAKQVAAGDLTEQEIRIKNKDEIGELAVSFKEMSTNLRNIIREVALNAEQVAASSEQLTASAEQTSKATEQITMVIQDVSVGVEKQVQRVEETSETIREMSQGIDHVAHRAERAAEMAGTASKKALGGSNIIQTAIMQMNTINETVVNLSSSIKGLGGRSNQIGQIVDAITAIAEQTNLLALNAAIEAARAGEQGRGFAVVADEVRKLAEQSARSAQQISLLIASIQKETGDAVQSMETTTHETSKGISVIQTAGQSFREIKEAVEVVNSQIEEVSSFIQQMSAGANEIVRAMEMMKKVAESTAEGTQEVSAATEEQLASMEEISASAHALANMAESLKELIQKFKIS